MADPRNPRERRRERPEIPVDPERKREQPEIREAPKREPEIKKKKPKREVRSLGR